MARISVQIDMARIDCLPLSVLHNKCNVQIGNDGGSAKVCVAFYFSDCIILWWPCGLFLNGLLTPSRIFERVKVYCSKQIESIPMSFVLGFYVTLIVKRWWDQYWILPMPDSLALYISASIHGQVRRRVVMNGKVLLESLWVINSVWNALIFGTLSFVFEVEK